MVRSRGASTSRSPDKIFAEVRFVLFGFDSVSEAQYLSELVRRGGVDVGKYDLSCTHVVVSGRVYDDPVCVAARNDGKILVTELWIDDSVDFGTLADPTRILYRPLKDLNGIPGSESLFICLTGYQRPERDDIMKMVSLMGARFSKPLIANQVTHLICYKFEGEKYELAKKVNIKLVNHRWLEDCLKAWEILPIDDYTKSGCELEILEAEARDSEEETEDDTRVLGQKNNAGNSSFQGGMSVSVHSDMSIPSMGIIGIHKDTGAAKQPQSGDDLCMNSRLFTTCKGTGSGKALDMSDLSNKVGEEFGHHNAGDIEQAGDGYDGGSSFIPCDINLKKQDNKLSTDKLGSTSSALAEQSSSLSYSRRTPKKSVLPEELSNMSFSSPLGVMKENTLSFLREGTVNDGPADMQGPAATSSIHDTEAISNGLPQKRKISLTRVGSKSPKSECQGSKSSAPQSPLACIRAAQLEFTTAIPQDKSDIVPRIINSPVEEASNSNSVANQSKPSLIYRKKSLKCRQPGSGTKIADPTSSPSDAKEADLPSLRRAIDENVVRHLPNLKSTITSAKVSPADSKLLPDLLHDNEPRQAADKHASLRNSVNHFGSLVIEGRIAEEASSKEKISGVSLGGLGESECATKCDNLDNAMNDFPSAKESPELHKPRHDEAALSPNRREPETRKSFSTASSDTCKGNNVKATSGAHTKKAVAKRTMNSRPKPPAGSTRKDKVVTNSDKAATLDKAGVRSGKAEKVSSNVVLATAASDEINGAAQAASKDVVMEDRVEVAQHIISASNNKNVAVDWMETSMDPEKENKPEEDCSLTFKSNGSQCCKMVPQHDRKMMQKNKNAGGVDTKKTQTRKDGRLISSEPVWFILSGHRLQRKEFQTVIRCLRGRVCRDSHHWSYQATHFIAPDPVRRTEKFFAAAAAGRWILKMDYLTASNQAGKFLDEEPFEWYRSGLTGDGAISLEAPRKWRLLRERTGHGAFHGMQVIVYGECIAPTLDTLKRVVKAGDGTILATSPPYTRFLKSGGVDYAVISPGMPRVDLWVQEFLRHEIPCVVADYLVEYVCKPGYSLERHVLYNTHAWAEKSFANLLSRSEEIIADVSVPSKEGNDDLSCSVCGSRDRGEVMLICGDESGNVGCGIGTHIDCCDPPLEAVPDGDWFCSKCSSNASKTPFKGSKKTFTRT
ncbi:BRCT domain-containing protein At4g02110 [Phoenix dactylifera]|uniref:BRCT domain-containing protein At4g02110 n=1 Tax=Phoenix dactylifera TaxID=42345 RepID=A0A8B8J184_PHODC|nr:BRCT domain-containing protein At4g02110 [Phoenix dactylifera]